MFFEHWVFWSWLFFVGEWAIRLVMLVWVPQKRSPAAARTWLLLIFIEPVIGLVLYGVFGRPYMPRRRVEMLRQTSRLIRTRGHEVLAPYITRPDLPTAFQHAIELAENLGDFPILSGNRVELLPDYEGALTRLVADIDAATHHVHLLYYIFADDAMGRRVADALVRARKRGVDCRVLMDAFGSKRALRTLAPRLRADGIEVIELLPMGFFRRNVARFDLRNHRKIAVLDGRVGYVGSQNLVAADFKPGIVYEELVARVTGPVVLQLQAVLLADYYFETEDEEIRGPSFFPDPGRMEDGIAAQTLPSGPGYPYENNLRLIVALIYAAQKKVVITTPYFIPDDSLLQAMTTAVLRGVEVHLIVSLKPDQLLVSLAQRSFYDELLVAGVRIHLYKHRFLHAKHISIDDGVAVIGSTNMDMRSFTLLAEVVLIVYDAQVVKGLHGIQERYLADADLLTLEEWGKRPMLTRWVQNMARLVDSVL
jgi:cardiolipin synthase